MVLLDLPQPLLRLTAGMSDIHNTATKLEVAIVGGGIVGLICAIAMVREGINVQLYEATEKFAEIGAGIGLSPNTLEILRSLGVLYDIFPNYDSEPPISKAFAFRYADDDLDFIVDTMEGGDEYGMHRMSIHRAILLDALVKHVDPSITHFGKRLQRITTVEISNRKVMHFKDGTTAEADVVVGADGIKSTTRRLLFGEDEGRRVVFTGSVAYRGLVKFEDAKAIGINPAFMIRPHSLIWRGKHLIILPMGNLINIVAFVTDRSRPFGQIERDPEAPWVIPVTSEQMLADFADCGTENSDTKKLLRAIINPTKWFLHAVHPPLDTFVKDKVALVGDAAHAMLPHLGAGAGQGMEDAYLLAKLLGRLDANSTGEEIESTLQSYTEARKPRAQQVWEGSLKIGDIYEGAGPHGFTKDGMKEDLYNLRDGLFYHGLNEDLKLITV